MPWATAENPKRDDEQAKIAELALTREVRVNDSVGGVFVRREDSGSQKCAMRDGVVCGNVVGGTKLAREEGEKELRGSLTLEAG